MRLSEHPLLLREFIAREEKSADVLRPAHASPASPIFAGPSTRPAARLRPRYADYTPPSVQSLQPEPFHPSPDDRRLAFDSRGEDADGEIRDVLIWVACALAFAITSGTWLLLG